jgi:nitroreductase
MTAFSELLKKRRSVRRYQDRDVPLEIVREVIADCTYAPSANNQQPWGFVIVNDREYIKKASDESKKNLLARIGADPEGGVSRYEESLRDPAFNVFYNAPCLVIILGAKDSGNAKVDCSLAASYFMLSAASRGLGTCWIGLGSDIQDPKMLDELGITDDYQIVAPIILGYPEEIPPVPDRNAPRILKTLT